MLEHEAHEEAMSEHPRKPIEKTLSPQEQAEVQIAFFEAHNARITGKWQSFRDSNNSKPS